MLNRDRIVAEPLAQLISEKMYVAVGKDVKKSKSTLLWALHHSIGRNICILHVHQPAPMIPLYELGTKLPASSVKEQRVSAHREKERQEMHEMLDEYILICQREGVNAEKRYIEMGNVEKGIVELVTQHEIKKLVMGAAEDKHYSRKMVELKSKKAIYVRAESPASCQIWFICKGHLIHTKDVVARPLPSLVPQNYETKLPKNSRSRSVPEGQGMHLGLGPLNSGDGMTLRVWSEIFVPREVNFSPEGGGQASNPWSGLDTEGSSDECGEISKSVSLGSGIQSRPSCESVSNSALIQFMRNSESKDSLHLHAPHRSDANHNSSSGEPDEAIDGHSQLRKSTMEAEVSKQNKNLESFSHGAAEKEAYEAFRRVKISESLCIDELKQWREIEDALARERNNLERIKSQRDEVMRELQAAIDQKSLLESQWTTSDHMVKDLKEKIASAAELLQNYERERDELQIERDNALREAEQLRKQYSVEVPSHMPQLFIEFSFSEIEEAARNFDPSLKIGRGGYGSIYRGTLRHTEVAIKVPHTDSSQGPSEYQREVQVLSKLRHPNLITLIGACPVTWTLVYEYLPNGSLEDRLSCRDNSAPLSWQTRIRIAAELCSVLIFLHSIKPHAIVHGDLKPSNILLDANLVSKLSDFGICREISKDGNSNNNTSCCITVPKGTVSYMDPEFLMTGELSAKSDVYSFGVILLQLLTGRPALGIAKEVQHAVDKGDLDALLDHSGGDWPFVQAEQLANLALRCCEMNRKHRPNLASDVWRVIEPMKASGGCQIPRSYICPLFQEVMHDPHVAADGYSYEAEAIRGWIESDRDSSPMTNHKLSHLNLIPNLALRSAIREWQQTH